VIEQWTDAIEVHDTAEDQFVDAVDLRHDGAELDEGQEREHLRDGWMIDLEIANDRVFEEALNEHLGERRDIGGIGRAAGRTLQVSRDRVQIGYQLDERFDQVRAALENGGGVV